MLRGRGRGAREVEGGRMIRSSNGSPRCPECPHARATGAHIVAKLPLEQQAQLQQRPSEQQAVSSSPSSTHDARGNAACGSEQPADSQQKTGGHTRRTPGGSRYDKEGEITGGRTTRRGERPRGQRQRQTAEGRSAYPLSIPCPSTEPKWRGPRAEDSCVGVERPHRVVVGQTERHLKHRLPDHITKSWQRTRRNGKG